MYGENADEPGHALRNSAGFLMPRALWKSVSQRLKDFNTTLKYVARVNFLEDI
jgi:hypothetical protein